MIELSKNSSRWVDINASRKSRESLEDLLRKGSFTAKELSKRTDIGLRTTQTKIKQLIIEKKVDVDTNSFPYRYFWIKEQKSQEGLKEQIEKSILKTLSNEYNREFLKLPFIWYHEKKNWSIAKLFKTYDLLEKADFDRRERLLKIVADELGYDRNNQDFRDEFAKAFSTLIYS